MWSLAWMDFGDKGVKSRFAFFKDVEIVWNSWQIDFQSGPEQVYWTPLVFIREIAVLSLFDDEVDKQIKANVVANLKSESLYDYGKRYVPSKEEMSLV